MNGVNRALILMLVIKKVLWKVKRAQLKKSELLATVCNDMVLK